jgi:hypothetical protein
MSISFFAVKFDKDKEHFLDGDFQKFIVNKKLNSYKSVFFTCNDKSYLAVLIDYEVLIDNSKEQKGKLDLSEAENQLFIKFISKEQASP